MKTNDSRTEITTNSAINIENKEINPIESVKERYDFMALYDVKNGNPNGDPDADNSPRIDLETGKGIVTNVCIKRKIRNRIQEKFKEQKGYKIFIKKGSILNDYIEDLYKKQGIDLSRPPVDKQDGKKRKQKGKGQGKEIEKVNKDSQKEYYDIRTFGAVLSTGANAGQVKGAVQITDSESIDPISIIDQTITRMAVTTKEDSEEQGGSNQTMGRKSIVPYGLYAFHGFVIPSYAQQNNFSEKDLEIFWEALDNMFENDRSAARGLMTVRKIIVFKHDSALGNAKAGFLFDLINIERKNKKEPARKFSDYEVTIETDRIPEGVTLIEK